MRLMYTSHPESNQLQSVLPTSLVNATKQRLEVPFEDVVEVRSVVRELAMRISMERPDLIVFFATGGVPYMFPLMDILLDEKEYELVDGSKFHLFPGLAWDGQINGLSPRDYFAQECGPLIKSRLSEKIEVKIVIIDTTFTGNAINLAVSAMEHTCDSLAIKDSSSVSVLVIGILDQSRALAEPRKNYLPVDSKWGLFYLAPPSGYIPESSIEDRKPIWFAKAAKSSIDLTIEYWVSKSIPTEDKAALIGAHAFHDTLQVASGGERGRLLITFENGLNSESSGLGTIAQGFLSLIKSEGDSPEWRMLSRAATIGALSDSERALMEESKVYSEAVLRFFELKHVPANELTSVLAQSNQLLTGPEIYQLAAIDPLPFQMNRQVKAALRQSPKALYPALCFLRLAYPQLAALEPDIDLPGKRTWWLERLQGT